MRNAPSIGTQIGVAQTKTSVALTGGLFTISDLDFGSGAFNGDPRWLQLAVKCPGYGRADAVVGARDQSNSTC